MEGKTAWSDFFLLHQLWSVLEFCRTYQFQPNQETFWMFCEVHLWCSGIWGFCGVFWIRAQVKMPWKGGVPSRWGSGSPFLSWAFSLGFSYGSSLLFGVVLQSCSDFCWQFKALGFCLGFTVFLCQPTSAWMFSINIPLILGYALLNWNFEATERYFEQTCSSLC